MYMKWEHSYILSSCHTQALVVIMTAMHMETTHLLAYDPCTMSGWWKLACPILTWHGTGLNPSFSSSVNTRLTDSMSPNEASVIGKGIPLRDHLHAQRCRIMLTRLNQLKSHCTCVILVWNVDHLSLVSGCLKQCAPSEKKKRSLLQPFLLS